MLSCSVLPVSFQRQLRLIVTMDGITHITTEAITTDIATKGITTGITIVGITIGTALGLSASMGVQDIIAIGKRNCARPGRFSTSKRSLCRN